jgi:hypothetical protein
MYIHQVGFVAFPVTEYDEVLSGYQPGEMVEDKDRDGLRNVGLLTAQPSDLADSLRELHHIFIN